MVALDVTMANDNFLFANEFNVDDFKQMFSPLPHANLSTKVLTCQSLRNKYEAFSLFLNTIDFQFDVICVTEAWLYDDELQFVQLKNYNFTGTRGSTRGGGVFLESGVESTWNFFIPCNETQNWENCVMNILSFVFLFVVPRVFLRKRV